MTTKCASVQQEMLKKKPQNTGYAGAKCGAITLKYCSSAKPKNLL